MAEFAKGRSMLYSSTERFDSYQYENEFGVASYFRVCDTYAHEIGHQYGNSVIGLGDSQWGFDDSENYAINFANNIRQFHQSFYKFRQENYLQSKLWGK